MIVLKLDLKNSSILAESGQIISASKISFLFFAYKFMEYTVVFSLLIVVNGASQAAYFFHLTPSPYCMDASIRFKKVGSSFQKKTSTY